jgi:hypothetical protein
MQMEMTCIGRLFLKHSPGVMVIGSTFTMGLPIHLLWLMFQCLRAQFSTHGLQVDKPCMRHLCFSLLLTQITQVFAHRCLAHHLFGDLVACLKLARARQSQHFLYSLVVAVIAGGAKRVVAHNGHGGGAIGTAADGTGGAFDAGFVFTYACAWKPEES